MILHVVFLDMPSLLLDFSHYLKLKIREPYGIKEANLCIFTIASS